VSAWRTSDTPVRAAARARLASEDRTPYDPPVDYSHVFNLRRWRERFRGEQEIVEEALEAGRTPDATTDEVGAAPDPVGFDGQPFEPDPLPNGFGTGTVGGPGWAGWG
jgi:hypothetical protein